MKRTRARSACEHCRLKKTKCDEARPSCSQCKTRNVQCTYKDSVPTKLERTLSLLFQRIEDVDSKLESLFNQETANKKPLNCSVGDKTSAASHHLEETEPYMIGGYEFDEVEVDLNGIKGSTTPDERNRIIYLEDQYSLKGRFQNQPIIQSNNNFNSALIKKLKDAYLRHIYPVFPLLCEQKLSEISQDVSQKGLQADFETCILLLVLALGAISLSGENNSISKENFWNNPNYQMAHCQVDPPPGWSYFWLVLGMKSRLVNSSTDDLSLVMTPLLCSLYFLKLGDIVSHCDYLQEACTKLNRQLFRLKQSPSIGSYNQLYVDTLRRIFWVSLDLERNMENMASIPKSELSSLQQWLGLPTGCKHKFPFDSNESYAFCYTSSILLSNIRDKTALVMEDVNSVFDGHLETICLRLESDILRWRQNLSIDYQWEDGLVESSCPLELLLLRVQYYLTLVTIYKLYATFDESYNERLVVSSVRLIEAASQLSPSDLTPTLCNQLIDVVDVLFDRRNYLQTGSSKKETSTIQRNVDSIKLNLQRFALHSPLLDRRLSKLHKKCDFFSFVDKLDLNAFTATKLSSIWFSDVGNK